MPIKIHVHAFFQIGIFCNSLVMSYLTEYEHIKTNFYQTESPSNAQCKLYFPNQSEILTKHTGESFQETSVKFWKSVNDENSVWYSKAMQ